MGVIKSISIYNGSNWGEPENIGADAANVSLSQNVWGTKNLDTVITSFFPSSTIAGGQILSLNGTTGKLQSTGITESQISNNLSDVADLLTDVSALKTDERNNNQIILPNTLCAGVVTGGNSTELSFFLPYNVTGGTTASFSNLIMRVRTSYPTPQQVYTKNQSGAYVQLSGSASNYPTDYIISNGSYTNKVQIASHVCNIRNKQGFYIRFYFTNSIFYKDGNNYKVLPAYCPVNVSVESGHDSNGTELVGIIIS